MSILADRYGNVRSLTVIPSWEAQRFGSEPGTNERRQSIYRDVRSSTMYFSQVLNEGVSNGKPHILAILCRMSNRVHVV
jgi:hypothetical protein